MADPNRKTVDKFILHHAVTPTWEEKSKAEIAQWFSDNGFARGYGSNPANWSGLINPYTGQRSYSMAAIAGQRVDGSTPDATDAERAAGYRIVELIQDIWGQITWNAGNWPVNCSCIGLENLGDYRNYPLRDNDMKVIADFWRPHDQQLGGATAVYGHQEVSQLGTQCPARIMEDRDQIVAYINNAPAPIVVPTPPAPEPVVEAPAAVPAANPYTRFPTPMDLRANKTPTNVYDLTKQTWAELSATIVKELNAGDQFVSVGKYVHPLGGVYFMTDYSFGQADITGTPAHPYGVNTIDLSPKPADPTPVVETPTTPAEPLTPPADSGAVDIPVKVIPADPLKWQQSFVPYGDGDYIASMSLVVKDLAGVNPDLQLVRAQSVKIAGEFVKDGVSYYITKASHDNGRWYGIPVKYDGKDTLVEDDNLFDMFLSSAANGVEQEAGKVKDTAIKTVASVDGFLHRILPHKK